MVAAAQWDTVRAEKHVLVIARTITALNRLLDVLILLSGDPRIEFWFTVDDGSVFSPGVADRLHAAGAKVLPWKDARRRRFHLALAASDHTALHRIRAPLMLLPHGVGHHRWACGRKNEISGLSPKALLHRGRVVPSGFVVAHPRQLDAVRALDQRLAARVLVAGDLCLDRMLANLAARENYRRALGAEGKHLVTLCSTWGPNSLFGSDPGLAARLLAELPHDQFSVAMALHPNVRGRHREFNVDEWLRPAVAAGLLLLPPEEGWRAAIIAADTVLSDHGSLCCYALGMDRPVLLAADGAEEVVPGSTMDTIRRRLSYLDHRQSLRAQIERAGIEYGLSGQLFSNVGKSAELLRDAMYELLGLAVAAPSPPPAPIPPPTPEYHAPRSFAVYTEFTADCLTLERFPAQLDTGQHSGARHLAAEETETDLATLERAAVICSAGPEPAPQDRLAATLRRYPGARIAAVQQGAATLLRTRDGCRFTVHGAVEPLIAASAVYAALVNGRVTPELTVRHHSISALRVERAAGVRNERA